MFGTEADFKLCQLDLRCGCIRSTQSRISVDINRRSPACKAEPRAAESQLIGLEISAEVTTKPDVFKAINSSSEGRCYADSTGNNAKRLGHLKVG